MTNLQKNTNLLLSLLVLLTGFVWVRSGWEKLTAEDFLGGMGKTLTTFASKNPNPMIKDFLTNTAIPNAGVFGTLVMWGETLIGLTLVLAGIYLMTARSINKAVPAGMALALLGAIWLNFVFYFSAGWLSASTESVNLYMLGVEAILLWYSIRVFKA